MNPGEHVVTSIPGGASGETGLGAGYSLFYGMNLGLLAA